MADDSWGLRWESFPIGADGPRIKVEIVAGPGYEGDALGFDLLARGIAKLIEEFDTHLLEKGEGYAEALHFYASILSAVARHYMVDADLDGEDGESTVQDILTELVEVLVQAGMLQETVGRERDDEDEEWRAVLGRIGGADLIDDEDWDDEEDGDDDADEP